MTIHKPVVRIKFMEEIYIAIEPVALIRYYIVIDGKKGWLWGEVFFFHLN